MFTKSLPLPSTSSFLPKYKRLPEEPPASPEMAASKKEQLPLIHIHTQSRWSPAEISITMSVSFRFVIVLCTFQAVQLCYLCDAPPCSPRPPCAVFEHTFLKPCWPPQSFTLPSPARWQLVCSRISALPSCSRYSVTHGTAFKGLFFKFFGVLLLKHNLSTA